MTLCCSARPNSRAEPENRGCQALEWRPGIAPTAAPAAPVVPLAPRQRAALLLARPAARVLARWPISAIYKPTDAPHTRPLGVAPRYPKPPRADCRALRITAVQRNSPLQHGLSRA